MDKEPKFAVGGSDPDLAKAKSALYSALVADAKIVRGRIVSLLELLLPYLNDPANYTADGTRLLSRPKSILMGRIKRSFPEIIRKIDFDIRSSVRSAINTTVDSQIESMSKKKLPVPTRQEADIVKEEALLGLGRDFPRGSGVTYENRLSRIERVHSKQLERIVGSTHTENAKSKITSDVRTALLHSSPGPTPVQNGSLAKKVMRLSSAESMRLVNEAESGLFASAGVEFAYWRLSPSHKWEGGGEICEQMASRESSDINALVKQRDAALMTEGLYLIKNWPSYPHPFCKCFAEAAI